MPEIGETLREARMRRRIDMTEVETATKIRGKYLRALENEEWDLLPGPTFVKSFLRTYAEYLGLDARLLVEEYRQRYERPATQDLTPFAARRAGRAAPRRRRAWPRPGRCWSIVGVRRRCSRVLLGARARCGTTTTRRRPRRRTRPARRRRDADAAERDERRRHAATRRAARRSGVRLRLVATGPVYVCLVDARGEQVIDEETLEAGHAHARRSVASCSGRTSATTMCGMRVNGKYRTRWRRAPTRSGTRSGPGSSPRRLSAAARPDCSS